MRRSSTRLFAGTLALALPLAAAAGCGVEKKRTIKQEFKAAQANLLNSKATSVTLRFADPKGTVKKAVLAEDSSTPSSLVDELIGSSITYTVDPASDKTFKSLDLTAGTSAADLKAELASVAFSIQVKDKTTTVGEFRLVNSTLYARADLAEVFKVAKEAGKDDLESSFDHAVDSADPKYKPILADVKAGKWLSLPLDKYISKLQDLAKDLPTAGATPAPGSKIDSKKIGTDLFTAVKPYIKVTDANDSSSNRVLNVKVQARPALKAALAALQAEKDLPFAAMLKQASPTDIDDNVADGTATGTITLKSGHLSQVAIDVDSIRTLDPDATDKDSLAGSQVIFDINDKASPVSAPTTDLSSVNLSDIVDQLFDSLGGITDQFTSSGSGSVDG